MNEVLVGIAAIPLIVALVQLIKPFIPDTRIVPVVAVALGIAYAGLTFVGDVGDVQDTMNITEALIVGAITGLSAVGLYSTVAPSIRGEGGEPGKGMLE